MPSTVGLHINSSIDILGSTTTPIVAPHRARRQLELIDCIDGLYGEGMLICVPCPTKLLAEVIHISHFRSLRHEQVAPLSDGTDGHRESSDILPRILSFSPGPWALEVCARVASEAKSVVGGKEPSSPPDTWDWESIGRIYQAAVALYCMASLPDSTDDCDTSLDLRSVLRDSLLQDLKQTSTDPNAQLRKLVLWPLTILGLELDGSDEAAQRFIISEMEWNSATMGIASPLVAKDLLEKVWLSHGGRGTPWESLFDRPYVFGL